MNIELKILDFIQTLHIPILDKIMVWITSLGDAGMIWILLTAIFLIMPKTRRTGSIMLVALLVQTILCNVVLKNLFARTRPYDVNTTIQLLVPKLQDFSFPSGHTLYRSSRRPYRQPPTVDLPSRQIWLRHWSIFHGFISSSVFRPMSGVSASR